MKANVAIYPTDLMKVQLWGPVVIVLKGVYRYRLYRPICHYPIDPMKKNALAYRTIGCCFERVYTTIYKRI